jgi:hypothetical protein
MSHWFCTTCYTSPCKCPPRAIVEGQPDPVIGGVTAIDNSETDWPWELRHITHNLPKEMEESDFYLWGF